MIVCLRKLTYNMEIPSTVDIKLVSANNFLKNHKEKFMKEHQIKLDVEL